MFKSVYFAFNSICITFVLQNLNTMLTVRLDPELEEFLSQYSEDQQLSKSWVVKEALAMYFQAMRVSKTPYELGEGLFGQLGSGEKTRSTSYKARIKEKLSEKYSH